MRNEQAQASAALDSVYILEGTENICLSAQINPNPRIAHGEIQGRDIFQWLGPD